MLKKAINSVTCFSFIAFPVFLFFASCHTRSFSSNGQNTPLNKKTTSAVDAIPPIKSTQFITDKSNRSPTGVKVIGNSVSKVLKVRLSEETVCILNSNKELQCFGDTEDHYSLSRLSKRDVVDFSLGLEHACALNGGGEIICLGLNKYCQLGSPLNAETTIPVESPIMVENFEGKSLSITGGDRFTCALFESSFARCWGSNFFTELSIAGCVPGYKRGQSCIMGKRIPPDGYAKVLAAKSITAYGDNACIITASGQLYCWGRNLSSGLGANEDEYIGDFGFVPVSGIDEKVRSVSITNSGYAFAITKSEKVYCFRFSSSDNDQDLDAFRAKGLGDNVSSVAAIRHPSIICTSGKNKNIRCWNYGRIDPDRAREGSARLCQVYEIGTPESKTIPEPVAFYDQPFHLPFTVLEDGAVGDIVFSRREMCTATSSGGAVCWGNSKKARQILGAPLHVYSPVSLENNLGHIEELYAGENCSCFSTMSKRYQCRGRGSMYTDNLFSIVSSLRDRALVTKWATSPLWQQMFSSTRWRNALI